MSVYDDEQVTLLSLLPEHPIFELPAQFGQSLPPSPKLAAIDRTPRKGRASPQPAFARRASTYSESEASSFDAPQDGPSLAYDDFEGSDTDARPRRKAIMAVVRETELVVAVGSEIRIAGLAEVKSKAEARSAGRARQGSVGSYKVRGMCA